ncbi:MAG: hypothetical protein RLZZ385_2315 [Pseudomonadota bacterium]|jgi:translation initiation factor 1
MASNSRPVYSTQSGRLCPECGQPVDACRCKHKPKPTWADNFSSTNRSPFGAKNAPGSPKSPPNANRSAPGQPTTPNDGIVRIHREKAGRGGKEVSVIKGLALNEQDLAALAKELKAKCGTGGTVKDGSIEIQGDHRERLKTLLETKGHKVKLAGG